MHATKPFATLALVANIFITINSPGMAQQSDDRSADPVMLENGNPHERSLSGGESHNYQVQLKSGEFLKAVVDQRGIDVVVKVYAPTGEKVYEIDSPNGSEGPEPIVLEPSGTGSYRIEVQALEPAAPQGRYQIAIEELLSVTQNSERKARERVRRDAITAWLRQNAIPLRSVTAGSGFADLQPLRTILKDVRLVGLGEATHGTREFFQFKHRMVEFLVREMGFRVFAIEASQAGCHNINEYVMGRTDDGASALDGQGFWTWNTEEVRDMLDWMRGYNASVSDDKKVKFVGYDLQVNSRARDVVLVYLRKVAPERAAGYEALPPPVGIDRQNMDTTLEGLVEAASGEQKTEETVARLADIRTRYNELLGFLLLNEGRLVRQSSSTEFSDALQHARLIAQYLESYAGESDRSFESRDDFMAENIVRLLQNEPPGTRMIVWAHNGHISTGDNGGAYRYMGWHLRRAFGQAYYALGFSFNKGSFQSRNADPKAETPFALTRFTVGTAAEASIDWQLAQVGIDNFLIDFRTTRKTAVIDEWTTTPTRARSVGSMYFAPAETQYYVPTTIAQEFDGLVFFDTVTRARPNPSVKNVAVERE